MAGCRRNVAHVTMSFLSDPPEEQTERGTRFGSNEDDTQRGGAGLANWAEPGSQLRTILLARGSFNAKCMERKWRS